MMRKWFICLVFAVSCTGVFGKGYSSGGGHSYSSGSHSSYSSHSYSGGCGSSHSYSSGSSHSYGGSSHSYSSSSGSSSGKSSSGSSSGKSSSGSSSGKSSSGSSSGKSSSGWGSSSGKSYSSGKSSSGSSGSSSGKSYSSGSGYSFLGGSSSSTPKATPKYESSGGILSKKPSGLSYDSTAAHAQQRQASKAVFQQSQAPKPTYVDGKGNSRPIPNDDRTRYARSTLSPDRWATRDYRARTYYRSYWDRPVVVYQDNYNSFFWWWLLDRSLNERAMWAYCHRDEIDSARYQALLAKDAQLQGEINRLQAANTPINRTYTPAGIDPDLAYTDEYADAVYNPVAPTPIAQSPIVAQSSSDGHLLAFFVTVLVIMIVGLGVYLVFLKRWDD